MLPRELIEEILLYLPFRISSFVLIGNYLKYYDKPNYTICDRAIICGNLEVLQWLEKTNVERFDGNQYILRAVEYSNGNLNIVKYLDKYIICRCRGDCDCYDDALESAARCNYIEIVEWFFHVKKYIGCDKAKTTAAEYGYLDMLITLYEYDSYYTEKNLKNATIYGHYRIVDWLINNNNIYIDNNEQRDAIVGSVLCKHDKITKLLCNHYNRTVSACMRWVYYTTFDEDIKEYLIENNIPYDDDLE